MEKKRNIRIRAEIDEIVNRKSIGNINKSKGWFFEKKSIKLIILKPG